MTPIAIIRHGPTDWNEQKRLQGRADRQLSDKGRELVSGWRLPEEVADFDWLASPLVRATETADLLGLEYRTEGAIIEMDWGEWEGSTLEELRREYGDEVSRRTAMGLDLRPHGGETPREVRARIKEWANAIAREGRPTGAVAHQGVIRALLSLATGWTMVGKPPHALDWSSVHLFAIETCGQVAVSRLNISLQP